VDASRSDPPTPRARAVTRAAQRREQEKAARKKERRIQRREEPAARAVGTLSPSDSEELVIGRGGGRREQRGWVPPRGGVPLPRRQGPERRQCSPPGS
jgi:hypothetical protein